MIWYKEVRLNSDTIYRKRTVSKIKLSQKLKNQRNDALIVD